MLSGQAAISGRGVGARPFSAEIGQGQLHLGGRLVLAEAPALWRTLRGLASRARRGALDLDLSRVETLDGAALSLLLALRSELAVRGVTCELVGAPERLRSLVQLYGGYDPPRRRAAAPRSGLIERVGEGARAAARAVVRLVAFIGDLTASTAGAFVRPSSVGLRSLGALVERAGTDGIPIVLLLNFLVGFVMAFQSARQLEVYGANLYVADVVGLSVTRELAPLMTGIIISGRSGASYAAELGAMKVSEELDALRTMGFGPIPYLVLPRVVALALVAPVLTLLGDVVGVLGGAVVGVTTLGVTPRGYLAELRTVMVPADITGGLLKSVAFGVAIALIGCRQGFATTGGAAGVGRRTTTTVVLCLFTIVVADTLFTLLFRTLGYERQTSH
jgi:phospholipid/cholesterol/gamma-HCH transport system permease protein